MVAPLRREAERTEPGLQALWQFSRLDRRWTAGQEIAIRALANVVALT
jgi:hypothetical protein